MINNELIQWTTTHTRVFRAQSVPGKGEMGPRGGKGFALVSLVIYFVSASELLCGKVWLPSSTCTTCVPTTSSSETRGIYSLSPTRRSREKVGGEQSVRRQWNEFVSPFIFNELFSYANSIHKFRDSWAPTSLTVCPWRAEGHKLGVKGE